MKLNNLKYGLLISVTTMFGGSSLKMYAQTVDTQKNKIELTTDYKKQFFESIDPKNENIKVDFVVDSVKQVTSNADLLTDVNVIQMLAYLDTDSDEYQSYMASRHIVAHEMWHRICLMNEVLEKPLSASLYRNGRDNFEITANLVQLLTFREDYKNATPDERLELRKLNDPKIRMYVTAVEQNIVNPFSENKKDFDFEMEFIAKTVSGFWNNNMSEAYAKAHNAMTEKAKRKEYTSPTYEENFIKDIKKMNTIGGIDFSQYYNVRDVRHMKIFEKGYDVDTTTFKIPLSEPDYEAWIDKRSKLKRFSKQKIDVPNFTGDRLKRERECRPFEKDVDGFVFKKVSGSKIYFGLQTPLYAAVVLEKNNETIKIYPHGAIDFISAKDSAGVAKIVTKNYDGSFETGQLKNNQKVGIFVYFDAEKNEIAKCTFERGRAQNGEVVFATDNSYIKYSYKNGKMTGTDVMRKDGVKVVIKKAPIKEVKKKQQRDETIFEPLTEIKENQIKRALNIIAPVKDLMNRDAFILYKEGKPVIQFMLDENMKIKEKIQAKDTALRVVRFYDDGTPKYEANVEFSDKDKKEKNSKKNKTEVTDIKTQKTQKNETLNNSDIKFQEIMYSADGEAVIMNTLQNNKTNIKVKANKFFDMLNHLQMPSDVKKSFVQYVNKIKQKVMKFSYNKSYKTVNDADYKTKLHKTKFVKANNSQK